MPRIFILPIEPITTRYPAQWKRWWKRGLEREGWEVVEVDGDGFAEPGEGEFLSAAGTWLWKGSQCKALADLWSTVKPDDVILIMDAWGPATTQALYLRDMTFQTGPKPKIVGYWHAGGWDPEDRVSSSGARSWSLDVERGWMRGLDLNLFATNFARDLALSSLGLWPHEINTSVVGQPVVGAGLDVEHAASSRWSDKLDMVVFPHRASPEKGIDLARAVEAELKRQRPHVVWKWTHGLTVQELYEVLRRAKVALSTSKQETFGIAMQEATMHNAWVIVPNRLSYPELYTHASDAFFYKKDQVRAIVNRICFALDVSGGPDIGRRTCENQASIPRASKAIKSIRSKS